MCISCVIPFFNSQQHLAATLECFEKQTLENFELILVDDGSTDQSFVIATEFCKRNEKFKLYSQKNLGVMAARKKGFLQAKNEFIVFFDSDDLPYPYYLECLYKMAIRSNSDICICSFLNYHEKLNILCSASLPFERYLSYPEFLLTIFSLKGSSVLAQKGGYLHNKVFRRSILKNTDFEICNSSAEDETFLARVAKPNFKYFFSPQLLYLYRISDNSLSTKVNFWKFFLLNRKRNIDLAGDQTTEEIFVAAYFSLLIWCSILYFKGEDTRLEYPILKSAFQYSKRVCKERTKYKKYIESEIWQCRWLLNLFNLPEWCVCFIKLSHLVAAVMRTQRIANKFINIFFERNS